MAPVQSKRLKSYLQRYRIDSEMSAELQPILEALRYREENLSIKAGATLGFCGLMIASVLVQMAAPVDSIIFVSVESPWAFFAKWALILLLLASVMTLLAINWGRPRYSKDVEIALGELAATVAHKRLMRTTAGVVCICGSVLASVCLLGPLLGIDTPMPFINVLR